MAPSPPVSEVDVIIVGAGPAGLMMANWLSRYPNIKTRIIDKRGTKIFNGQADGLQCRTLEIFDSFDFGHRAWIESNHMLEICLWNPDKHGVIQRSDRIPDTIPGISRFQQVVLHQGRIERFFLDSIKEHSEGKLEVEHGVLPTHFEFDESLASDPTAHPITVQLRHLTEEEATPKQNATSANGAGIQDGIFRSNLTADDNEELLRKARERDSNAGRTETVKARFMLGADGAHSWTRQQLGFKLEGDSTDYIWGVLDVIPITNFPDIRMRCAIHSKESGTAMVIPRENKLVRLYIQLTTTEKGAAGAKADRSKINPASILASAQRIMAPYTLEYRYCDWWTAYQIGQRVGNKFSGIGERVFLAGDAVHTHSPKAGQGMNVSMQDAYNLGWKVASVCSGLSSPTILKTYQSERRRIAQDLIDFDHRFSRLFSGRPAKDVMDEEGISMEEFKDAFEKGNMFASAIAVNYGASVIVAKASDDDASSSSSSTTTTKAASDVDGDIMGGQQVHSSRAELATLVKVGMRMPSFKVLNQADARPWHLQELLKSNGRWRVLIFAGDIVASPAQKARLDALGAHLAAERSFLQRFTPAGARYDAVVEVLTVHSAPRRAVTIFDFPEVLRPFDPSSGWDYWKIFVDDESYHEGHGQAYKNYGIDKAKGCVIVLRPDQYVSWIGDLDEHDLLDRFFDGFMIEQRKEKVSTGGSTGQAGGAAAVAVNGAAS